MIVPSSQPISLVTAVNAILGGHIASVFPTRTPVMSEPALEEAARRVVDLLPNSRALHSEARAGIGRMAFSVAVDVTRKYMSRFASEQVPFERASPYIASEIYEQIHLPVFDVFGVQPGWEDDRSEEESIARLVAGSLRSASRLYYHEMIWPLFPGSWENRHFNEIHDKYTECDRTLTRFCENPVFARPNPASKG